MTPAIRVITPMKISHTATGQGRVADRRHGSRHAAEDESDTDPDRQQQDRVLKAPEAQHRENQRGGAADEQQNSPAGGHMQAEREYHLGDAGDQQVGAEEDRGNDDRLAWPSQHENAENHRENPGQQRGLPQMLQHSGRSWAFHGLSVAQQPSDIWRFYIRVNQRKAGCNFGAKRRRYPGNPISVTRCVFATTSRRTVPCSTVERFPRANESEDDELAIRRTAKQFCRGHELHLGGVRSTVRA